MRKTIHAAHSWEKNKLKPLPEEVRSVAETILEMLDREYGADRDVYNYDGGYVIVAEEKKDFDKIKSGYGLDCMEVVPEYVEKIECCNGSIYSNSLILCNNEYAITLLMPMEITPDNLKEYIV